jgi:hypothetical protein
VQNVVKLRGYAQEQIYGLTEPPIPRVAAGASEELCQADRLLQEKRKNAYCSKKCANMAMAQRFQQREHQKSVVRVTRWIARFERLVRTEQRLEDMGESAIRN